MACKWYVESYTSIICLCACSLTDERNISNSLYYSQFTIPLLHSPMNMNPGYERQILVLTTILTSSLYSHLVILESISDEVNRLPTIEDLIHETRWKKAWNHTMTEMVTILGHDRKTLRFCPSIVILRIS